MHARIARAPSTNLSAVDVVLADSRRRLPPAAPVIVLGDLAFKVPWPEECVRRVRQAAVAVVLGNTDEYMGCGLQAGFQPRNERQRVLLETLRWTRERMETEQLNYLAGVPFAYEVRLGRLVLRFLHATPRDVEEAIDPDSPAEKLASMFERTTALGTDAADQVQAVAYGHVHVAWIRFLDGRLLLNPGVLLVGHIRIPYDIDATVAAARERALPDADSLERQLRTGIR